MTKNIMRQNLWTLFPGTSKLLFFLNPKKKKRPEVMRKIYMTEYKLGFQMFKVNVMSKSCNINALLLLQHPKSISHINTWKFSTQLSEQLKKKMLLGSHSFLKYSSSSLANSSFTQNVKVSCQHQKSASHNLRLISHLVHINNPPSWTEVIFVSSTPLSLLASFSLSVIYIHCIKNPGHPALRKHSVLISLSKFKWRGLLLACSVSGFADSPACRPT